MKKTFFVLGLATLTFFTARYFFGRKYLGERNAQSGTQAIEQAKPSERKIELLGMLSDLEAQANGVIATDKTADQLQQEIDGALKELQAK